MEESFIRDDMTDAEKALAVWKSAVMYSYQDAPPVEFRHEGCVHDPIKSFNVYGYGMCCCASSNVESLARYFGHRCARVGDQRPQRARSVL